MNSFYHSFCELPVELQATIAGFLSLETLWNFRLACKKFQQAADDDICWRMMWKRHLLMFSPALKLLPIEDQEKLDESTVPELEHREHRYRSVFYDLSAFICSRFRRLMGAGAVRTMLQRGRERYLKHNDIAGSRALCTLI